MVGPTTLITHIMDGGFFYSELINNPPTSYASTARRKRFRICDQDVLYAAYPCHSVSSFQAMILFGYRHWYRKC